MRPLEQTPAGGYRIDLILKKNYLFLERYRSNMEDDDFEGD